MHQLVLSLVYGEPSPRPHSAANNDTGDIDKWQSL